MPELEPSATDRKDQDTTITSSLHQLELLPSWVTGGSGKGIQL